MKQIKIISGILGILISGIFAAYAAVNEFQPVSSLAAGVSPRGIAVGDPYGQGIDSLVVANFGSQTFIGQTTPATLLNPQFSNLQLFSPSPNGLKLGPTIPTAASPRGVFLFELGNGRGQDILVTAYDANLIQVFSWEKGQFVKTGEESTQKMPLGLTAGFTGKQGVPMVVVANYGSNTLSLYQVSHGKLAGRFDVPVAEGPTQVAIGDLNGDGKNDIAVVCLPAHKIEILSGASGKENDLASYAISNNIVLPEGSAPADLRVIDLNGDGKDDLVVADFLKNSVYVYVQQKDGSLSPQSPLSTTGSHPNGLTVADILGNGEKEIIVANRDSDSIDLFQLTNGGFQLIKTLKTSEESTNNFGPIEVGVLDAVGNGQKSLVASHMRSNSIKIFSPMETSQVTSKQLTTSQGQMGVPFSEKTTFCFPNPTHDGNVKFSFTLEKPSTVNLQIYDVRGEAVWTQNLSSSQTQNGVNLLNWDGVNQAGQKLASGLYLYTLTVGDKSITKKIAIVH